MTCCFVAILMMYRSGRSRWHCELIMMTRYGLHHLYKVCCSTIWTEGGRNIHKAIKIIIPQKATLNYHNIFVNFTKFYEQGGVMSMVAPDLNSAQWAFKQGTKMPFRMIDELAEVWCEWAEMEIHNKWVFLGATFGVISDSIPLRNYNEMRLLTLCNEPLLYLRTPKSATKIKCVSLVMLFPLQSLPSQARLFKSLKLWSYYVDLEESIGTVETTKWVYNQILELHIANAQVWSTLHWKSGTCCYQDSLDNCQLCCFPWGDQILC